MSMYFTQAHQILATYLAISDQTPVQWTNTVLAWARPGIFLVTAGIALAFVAKKAFSKVWGTILIGAMVFSLTIGSGDSSLIGKLAHFIYSRM